MVWRSSGVASIGASFGSRCWTDFDGLLHPQARISFIEDLNRV
jgi:hypothetical protein